MYIQYIFVQCILCINGLGKETVEVTGCTGVTCGQRGVAVRAFDTNQTVMDDVRILPVVVL